jgi:nitrite reductase/ring-hydroxylating ferredoxin subunit
MSEGFAKVASLNDLAAGSMRKIQLGGEDVLVANIAGKTYAIADTCTHRGCSLSEGTIEGTELICPCHAAHFDLTTGKVTAPPAKKDVSSFVVRLQGSDVLVKKR